ncbi:MAG TPA: hypothetical protein VMH40_00550 [Myxococcaceae bacterium]|nr:hypothetical protein [Myxococcaceae bacterium]
MRRDLRIALLAAGVVAGFGSGIHALGMRHRERRLAWERHVAALCVDAARGTAGQPPGRAASPGEAPERW